MDLNRAMEIVKELQDEYDDLEVCLDRCGDDEYKITLKSEDEYEEEGLHSKVTPVLRKLIE